MTTTLYVYYRAAADAPVAERARAMQADLRARAGVAGRVLRRHDDPSTWMEVYEDLPDAVAFEELLADAVERHRMNEVLLAGTMRNVERFVAV